MRPKEYNDENVTTLHIDNVRQETVLCVRKKKNRWVDGNGQEGDTKETGSFHQEFQISHIIHEPIKQSYS